MRQARDREAKRTHPRTHGSVLAVAEGKRRKPRADNFRSDPLYPRVVRTVAKLLERGKVVTPVDVLVGMNLLTLERVIDWRHGRLPYLERVIDCNLSRLSRLLRILRLHAHDLNLKPSRTVYMRWGKGRKSPLRFTKTGDANLELAYSTHLIWTGTGPFHPPRPKASSEAPQEPPPRPAQASEAVVEFPGGLARAADRQLR